MENEEEFKALCEELVFKDINESRNVKISDGTYRYKCHVKCLYTFEIGRCAIRIEDVEKAEEEVRRSIR